MLKSFMFISLRLNVLHKYTKEYQLIQNNIKTIRQFGKDFVDAHITCKDKKTDQNNIVYRLYEENVPYDRIVDNAILFTFAVSFNSSNRRSRLLVIFSLGL